MWSAQRTACEIAAPSSTCGPKPGTIAPWFLALALMLLVSACGSSAEPAAEEDLKRPSGYPQPGHLVPLLRHDNPHIVSTASLIAKTGNAREKDAAAAQLIRLSDEVGADEWRESQAAFVERTTDTATLTQAQRARWLDVWHQRRLVRIYDALSVLGTERVLTHCRAVLRDQTRSTVEQKLALGVLASHGQATTDRPQTWSMPQAAPPAGSPPRPGVTTTWPAPPTGAPAAPTSSPAAPPRPDAPRVKGGQIINVNEVVDALRPYFKACYLQALRQYGRFGSWIILTAGVRGDGRVDYVTGRGDDSTPVSMMMCLRSVVAQARFAPPVGGTALVEIPLAFTVDTTGQAR